MNDELMQINEKRGPFYYIILELELLDYQTYQMREREREIKRGLIWLKSTLDRSFSLFPRIELIYLKFQVVKTIDDDDETEIKRKKKKRILIFSRKSIV